jgi:lipopolysaccharide/colanic/teichoic acid biosynthesis glycosyltransferase
VYDSLYYLFVYQSFVMVNIYLCIYLPIYLFIYALLHIGSGGPFLGAKARLGLDADHSPTSSA